MPSKQNMIATTTFIYDYTRIEKNTRNKVLAAVNAKRIALQLLYLSRSFPMPIFARKQTNNCIELIEAEN